jgi:hypothetical protein
MMVRSFERRIEALFLIVDEQLKKEAITILKYNLKDNQNTYVMREDGAYIKKHEPGEVFNLHQEFYKLTPEKLEDSASLLKYLTARSVPSALRSVSVAELLHLHHRETHLVTDLAEDESETDEDPLKSHVSFLEPDEEFPDIEELEDEIHPEPEAGLE